MTDLVGNQSASLTAPPATGGYFPVSLDLAGRACLVVGGGRVAARKVAGLLGAGACVDVVAPVLDAALEELAAAGRITVHPRTYRSAEAAGYRLVVTATGLPVVDMAVAGDADAAGVWVNSADDPANCTFILPAIHRDGPLTVAVSSGGASPALASWLRRRIDVLLDDLVGDAGAELAGLLAEGRARVKADGRSTETVDWQSLLDGPFPTLVRDGRIDEARVLLARTIARPEP